MSIKIILVSLFLAFLQFLPGNLFAGGIPSNQLHMPMGKGTPLTSGDYVSINSDGGLGTYYSYFIEVTPGLSSLQIDIFDADVGAGGYAEINGPRDRQRNGSWNTTTTYTLYDPTGTVRNTQFATGDSSGPAGSDNTWLNFFTSGGTGHYVRDEFSTASYSNNDGNSNWSTNWIETDSGGGGVTGGNIRVTGGQLRITGTANNNYIQRQVDLSPTGLNLTNAYLTFSYSTSNNLDSSDCVKVQVSGNGGSSWTDLHTYCNDNSETVTDDITSFIANNTRIRFIVTGELSNTRTNREYFYVDNVQIGDNGGGPATPGHWELRVEMDGNDDVNGFAIRAHDGDPTAGGTEVNVYAKSFVELGVNSDNYAIETATLYPFITSGCSAMSNDFDWDAAFSGDTGCGSISFSSRTGSFTQNNPDVSESYSGYGTGWLTTQIPVSSAPLSGWTTDVWSADYGIWTSNITINSCTGSGSCNYGTFYMGDSNAASAPPSSQPEAHTFRIYLPTDAGGAPVKPILTQTLSHFSGPNPPAVGQTSRVRIQVTVFNPTPFPITFSSSKLVTVNVPGSGAVYAGNPVASQGSITSQPSIGGTGNITWNPGTVSANSSVDLIYDIDVNPSTPGQRIRVTGTPASNGTTATYVDETGNTTQAIATYTYGPLCELAVTEGADILPTLASISWFTTFTQDGKVVLSWDTASEIGTAGFYLFRKDDRTDQYVRVNSNLLPGLITSPRGGTYRYIDEGAQPGATYIYYLVEIEQRGGRRIHGPFTVTPAAGNSPAQAQVSLSSFSRTAHPLFAAKKTRIEAVAQSVKNTKVKSPQQSNESTKIKISVNAQGMYLIDASDIATLLGTARNKVSALIRKKMFLMTNNGKEISYTRAKGNSGIIFYGEGINSSYTAENVYWLEIGNGTLMETVKGKRPAPVSDEQTFIKTVHAEQNNWSAEGLFGNPQADYWFWDYIVAGDSSEGSKQFTINVTGVANEDNVNFSANLQGATDTGHHAVVCLNGTQIGEGSWNGIGAYTLKCSFDRSLLREGDNDVEVTGVLDNDVPYSIFYINSFNLYFQSYFRTNNDKFFVRGNGQQTVTIEGFTNSHIEVFDITDSSHPKQLAKVTVNNGGAGGYSLSFRPESEDNVYLAQTVSAIQEPSSVAAGSISSLKTVGNSADYLIITTEALKDTAARLAEYRQSEGLNSMVVTQEAIMDEFNYGIYSPEAIKNFLSYAYANWSQHPEFVVLAGEGNYDYKNYMNFGGNLIPPIMIGTAQGLFPSDNHFADVNGDHVPEMAIGRLPAATAEELETLIGKIISYETSGGGDWINRILMVADNPDEGGDFTADSDSLAAIITPAFTVDKIYLSDNTLDETRQSLLNGLNSGAAFLNYLGHAGLTRLSEEGLLTLDDVDSLANQDRLPVVTSMTCVMGNYSIPGTDSLGTSLLLKQNGGSISVISPSGMSFNSQALILAKSFYESYLEGPDMPLGTILLNALGKSSTAGVYGYILDMYNLLGDPAMQIK